MSAAGACAACLRRSWLLERLAGNLEIVRSRVPEVLALGDQDLISAVGGRHREELAAEHAGFGTAAAERARAAAASAGLALICRCAERYPQPLSTSPWPPATLHLGGDPDRLAAAGEQAAVAIVGSRAASAYGIEIARALGRELAASGIPVLSGMALGIDAAALRGALDAGGAAIAVLPGSADRPYPPGKRRLHREILEAGVALSELGPGARIWRWSFAARNRIIAALAALTVVVEAGPASGALLTARLAGDLGRPVGAVPGQVTTPQADGPNRLIAGGAVVVRGAQDVLDALYGIGARSALVDRRPQPAGAQRQVLDALAAGHDTVAALAGAGLDPRTSLAELAALELAGWVRRGPGGRFTMLP